MATAESLKIPGRTTAAGRASSITNAFINAPLPYLEPSAQDKRDILIALRIDPQDVRCAYCGDVATEWDHFYPTVKNRAETGYFTEKANLVPACGKCNQSKGNKNWEDWIKSSAPLSPYKRGTPNLDFRIERLRAFTQKFPARKVDLSRIKQSDQWKKYELLREDVIEKLRFGDQLAKEIGAMVLAQSGADQKWSGTGTISLVEEG